MFKKISEKIRYLLFGRRRARKTEKYAEEAINKYKDTLRKLSYK